MTAHTKIKPRVFPLVAQALRPISNKSMPNGIRFWELQHPPQEAMKIQWVFKAGRTYEDRRAQAMMMAGLLKSGTSALSASSIARFLDDNACHFAARVGSDYMTCTLQCLHKQVPKLMPVIAELMEQSIFPSSELEILRQRSLHRLQETLNNGDVVSFREMTALLFGESHPYGYNTTVEDLQSIQREDVVRYYADCVKNSRCEIYAAGGAGIAEWVESSFGMKAKAQIPDRLPPLVSREPKPPVKVQLPEASQVSIKLGQLWPDSKDEDSTALSVLNTLLGAYFGSRLVKKLREELGLTYNTFSAVHTMRAATMHYISVECNPDKSQLALDSIGEIMSDLSSIEVSLSELNRVKAHMLGAALNAQDGAFSIVKLWKTVHLHGLKKDHFEDYQRKIMGIQAHDIQRIAKRYLRFERYQCVMVGDFDKCGAQ